MNSKTLGLILWQRKRWRFFLLCSSFFSSVLGLLAPYFQKQFIDDFSSVSIWLSFSCLLLSQALNQITNYIGIKEALLAQKKIAEKIYSQMLSLKVDTLSEKSVGEIVSLYATDVPGSTILLEQTLPQGATTFFPLILAPIALAFTLKIQLFWTILGIIFVSFLNTFLAFRQSKFFFAFKQLAALRIGLVGEWINNMRGLRILGWTSTFEDKIVQRREAETKNRIRMVTNGQFMNSISSTMTFVINVATLAVLVYASERTPTVGEILSCLWIIAIFLTRPFRQMPWFFTFAFDGWTSIKRIDQFLSIKNNFSMPAQTSIKANALLQNTSLAKPVLQIQGLHLKFPHQTPILNNISFELYPHEFVAVVGEVGSGKSLFLLSLLRETGASFAKYEIQGKTIDFSKEDLSLEAELKKHFSYVPQESFIMSAKLGQNVLFDYKEIEPQNKKIQESLLLAQFIPHQERFPDGLNTEIGEKGVNLSGGQKQRISLSRAIYHDRDIVLIDDGFSNLDVKTEELILQKLFFDIWKDKTKILATHRLSVLPKTDRIIFLKNGHIVATGKFEELLLTSPDFREFTSSLNENKTTDEIQYE